MQHVEAEKKNASYWTFYVAMELVERLLDQRNFSLADQLIEQMRMLCKDQEIRQRQCTALHVIALLMQGEYEAVAKEIQRYDVDMLSDEATPFYWIYGCFLAATGKQELALTHFSTQIEIPYPRCFGLLGKYLHETQLEREKREKRAFLWENRILYRQLRVWYLCKGEKEEAEEYARKARVTYLLG